MPQRWAMWMAVRGDLRFASHHDMMRVVERTLLRGKLPLKYSQGFSPRAIMSLAFPRPVGVAAKRDLLVIFLDSSMLRQELLAKTNRCCPKGLTFTDATRLETKATPQPAECTYQIPIPSDKADAVARVVENFSAQDSYPIQRTKPPKRRGRGRRDERGEPIARTLDLKLLIDHVEFDGATLSWRQRPHQTLWAKPTEAMDALGLDPAGDLAFVTRISLTFQDLNEYSGDPDDKTAGEPETT